MTKTPPPMSAGWALDELASAGRENLDPGHARQYDAREDADAAAEVALLRDLGLDGDSVLVDLGAGTGQLVAAAAPVCGRVVAVDISPVMLQPLRAKIRDAGLSNVRVVEAGFLSYEHRGRPADFVYSRWALHHLPDFWKAVALDRVHRILRPDGILRLSAVVYDFEPGQAAERLEAWCASYEDAADGQWGRADLEEHIRDEHSTFSWVLEPMIERCGFVIERTERSPDGFFASYVARAS